MGGNIINTSTINELVKKGKDSQKARQATIERHRKEEEEVKKAEEMKKLLEDTGTSSQTAYSKSI
jgi:hypothetical protein